MRKRAFSKSGGTLKHSTGLMKKTYMDFVLTFRDGLKNSQREIMTEGTRQWVLAEIKRLSPDYHEWYDKVYRLRADDKHEEYERAIREKYYQLTDPALFRVSLFNRKARLLMALNSWGSPNAEREEMMNELLELQGLIDSLDEESVR